MYQSASAVVFILSIPILRERVTLLKIASVGFTVAGVSLVSVFTMDPSTPQSNTTLPELELGGAWDDMDVVATAAPYAERTTPLGYVVSDFGMLVE